MSKVITTAGRAAKAEKSAKREAIARIRQVLRDQAAKDEDVDDALEALTEIARTED